MPKYIKLFNTYNDYETAKSELDLPNVSVCKDNMDIAYYNPFVEKRLVVKYNIKNTSEGYINKDISNFSEMEIDGVTVSPVSKYAFSTTGEHIVKYTLIDPTIISSGSAFSYCSNIVDVEIPNTVVTVDDRMFNNCGGLTSVTIPDSVTTIGDSAFSSCNNLLELVIPDSVTSIGNFAFENAYKLSSLTIGNGVEFIGTHGFRNAYKLEKIEIPSNVKLIGSSAFAIASGATELILDEGIETISGSAFQQLSSLTSVEIPSTVTTIGIWAFKLCTALTSITVKATTPPTMITTNNRLAFESTNDCPIYVPANSVSAYKAASGWSSYASRIQAIQ